MPYKIDYLEDAVLAWSLTPSGVTCDRITDYTPTIYVEATEGGLDDIRTVLDERSDVADTAVERWRTGFRHEPTEVIRVDIVHLDRVRPVAWSVRRRGQPSAFRCYNVDLSREFRYCLEQDRSPLPAEKLSTLSMSVPTLDLREPPVSELHIDGDEITGSPETILDTLQNRVDETDPDVLLLETAEIIPHLYETAELCDVDLQLGRKPGWQQLAGMSTYESYGRVGHSPARYNLPGRAIVDRSNTFIFNESNLHGCLDLVERSWKPLQELAWASIGNILTAIQIREARDRGVLVPWRSWRHEFFKPMSTLHDADRGGFIFSPDIGFHEDVHELDFSSLYPNIIVTRNISPETTRCECHRGREDVPGLGYAICDEPGYLPDVLRPLIEDRDVIKATLGETEDPERRRELEGKADAIKWILVSCFGYQGFSNAKFGRIECHEAINAYAREILLDTKTVLETNGWKVVHGIVDSIWVTPIEGEEQTPLQELASTITEQVGIRLEDEGAFDWVAFVPLRSEDNGALTKYFGARADPSEGDTRYKFRGIEIRQRSTPAYIEQAQRDLIEALDGYREPEPVCDVLQRQLVELRRGEVDPQMLLIDNRVSKGLDEYTQYTRNVAALERSAAGGIEKHPGENVSYVVVDDDKQSRDRVALAHESPDTYDSAFYSDLLVRAAESVMSPLGWRERNIRAYLSDRTDARLTGFG